ncbi:response regulator transcription factor [Geosporobacter ferrireducens]|uniref:Stage 0 sporulation protein A homolog n=1 Tax=Geosporobacter ferrireducens TaxID=1424294 RepID=A0A1D8GK23_9FIRM|nr:response regulator [Geosporobacter ferrireducens]AOT71261.1 hypothetical protein Gferi_17895 [Geosporobacter ferrireducens]
MIKLMIVEDELIERKSLCYLLEKFFGDQIEIVYEAADGSEGLEKALELQPQIILMDIHMPGMDGLKTAEEIKKELKEVEIIILTAYSYFEYAQRAIPIGIVDYLVKPFSNNKFNVAVEKAIEKIRDRENQLNQRYMMQQHIQRLGVFLEKEIVIQLVHGTRLSIDQLENYKQLLDISYNTFLCINIRVDLENILDGALLETVKGKFKKSSLQAVGYVLVKELVLFIFGENLEDQQTSEGIASTLKEVQCDIEAIARGLCYIGKSRNYRDMINIKTAYSEAKKKIRKLASLEKVEARNKTESFQYPYEKEVMLCEKIINEDALGTIQIIRDISNYLSTHFENANLEGSKSYFKQLYVLLERNIIQFFGNTFQLEKLENVHKAIDNTQEFHDIQRYMEKLVQDMIDIIAHHKQDRNQKMIESVKGYIEENYKENISLKQAADFIGISSYYLSKCFKKEEGINFKEYLIKVRMKKAKYLMREENKTVQEAAYEVGYPDPSYFSKAFKKYVGISPTKFMDR